MNIFISHITEEAPIALLLKEFIEQQFLGLKTVFASSNVHDLTPGNRWLEKIEDALKESEIMLVICSPSSLTRPWINFEAGCAWMKGMEIIPICHSGQRKDLLPHPFSELQALQLEDSNCGKLLLQALCKHFRITRVPAFDANATYEKIREAMATISVPDASPQIIHSPKERTKLIINDLETLLKGEHVENETVWTSAFLSILAIGSSDNYPEKQHDHLELLLKERELLLSLARKGCTIKCIISPANKNHIRHAGIEYAIQRTKRLLKLLKQNDIALDHIDWAVSELGTKNLYIIGNIACFEGYEKDIKHGYGLTLRQTSRDVINANIDVYRVFFKYLEAKSLAKWGRGHDSGYNDREFLRIAAKRCLEDSLEFLLDFSRNIHKSTGLGRSKRSHKP